jgi:hypothetical protein
MASGHANRTNRPNTWLHRPSPGRPHMATSAAMSAGEPGWQGESSRGQGQNLGRGRGLGMPPPSHDNVSFTHTLAKMWLYLSEPVDDMPGHYELPKHRRPIFGQDDF